MSVKKNDELRSALKKLNVSEPLRLSKSGPSFKPPDASQKREEVPRIEAPLSGAPRYKGSQKELAQNESPQFERPQNKPSAPKNGLENTANSNLNRFEGPHLEWPRNEAPQIEGAEFERAQNEATQIESARFAGFRKPRTTPSQVSATNGGSFFKLSDRAFSLPQLQRVSGDSFRLFIWMSSKAWRFVKSDGTLRASIGYIEEGTGMSHATISRCIRTLREEGLVTLLETDYKRGNIWQISPAAFAGSGPGDLPPRFELPQNEGAQNVAVAPSKRGASSLNLRGKVPQIEVEIRSIKKSKESSQEATSLFARLDRIRAVEKQKSERDCLLQLLQAYSAAELERATSFVERHGILGGREACHSPYRYLISAADDVLKIASRTQTPVVNLVAPPEPDPVQSKETSRAALASFEGTLTPTQREEFVARFVEQEFGWGYVPAKPLLIQLAANSWYFQNQNMLQRANG
jgi:hypothetical protein